MTKNVSFSSCPPDLGEKKVNATHKNENENNENNNMSYPEGAFDRAGSAFAGELSHTSSNNNTTNDFGCAREDLAGSIFTVPASMMGPEYNFLKEAGGVRALEQNNNNNSTPLNNNNNILSENENDLKAEMLNLLQNKKITYISDDEYTFQLPSVDLHHHNNNNNNNNNNAPLRIENDIRRNSQKLVIIMVGLPARGKTFLAQKVCRLLGWQGFGAKVQNIQIAWRKIMLEFEESLKKVEKMRREYYQQQNSHPPAENENEEKETLLKDCLTADHFRKLLLNPDSNERRLYRHVLKCFADDARNFFSNGGNVVVVNDDFITCGLRQEAEFIFSHLGSEIIYMEVLRDEDRNDVFKEGKVADLVEYPREKETNNPEKTEISEKEGGEESYEEAIRKDFEERLQILTEHYESLRDALPDNADYAEPHADEKKNNDKNNKTNDNNNEISRATVVVNNQKIQYEQEIKSYIKVRNGEELESHRIKSFLGCRVIAYIMSLSQTKVQHPIFFVRHGESCYNLEDRIGGNPLLTRQGMKDAAALLEFMDSLKQYVSTMSTKHNKNDISCDCHHVASKKEEDKDEEEDVPDTLNINNFNNTLRLDPEMVRSFQKQQKEEKEQQQNKNKNKHDRCCHHHTPKNNNNNNNNNSQLEIWTSQLRRAIQTAELSERLLHIKTLRWSSLNEIHGGICEDMTYEDVKHTYPLIYQFRKLSKYTFRYPEGESYQDIVSRLEPVILELENADRAIVVVAHQAVLRCLLAYFGNTSAEYCVELDVPHRTVWRCNYNAKGIAQLEELYLENDVAGF
ncbi:6-phosphofructo-2-kinase/Histidine phosphatase superfamily (branch 1), putative [Angomonas deanei]|uniref:6-phosphofructo-2-kinase/Histidine phosphatase superfamily (Branch 1), putative n=1 Tax=Angomonas deanei TaxID=59799 RepID=A0A7G2CUL1_9TRYP|nr:6-phosphofructo-2-kinase/Histidine phosphatase superfamily (branch 1), putative [Angomonas deanei]